MDKKTKVSIEDCVDWASRKLKEAEKKHQELLVEPDDYYSKTKEILEHSEKGVVTLKVIKGLLGILGGRYDSRCDIDEEKEFVSDCCGVGTWLYTSRLINYKSYYCLGCHQSCKRVPKSEYQRQEKEKK